MKHFLQRRAAICLAATVLGCTNGSAAPAPTWTAISWKACAPSQVDGKWIDYWGKRLECGSMFAPIADDQGSSQGLISVGLVRVTAGKPRDRLGSLFFNFGGPGRDPRHALPDLAYLWSLDDHRSTDSWPLALSERFDLVAVVPRGLGASPCESSTEAAAPRLGADDAAWTGFLRQAEKTAAACNKNAIDEYMGTLQHVQDMERARLALREPSMNFLGYSYGAWAGAFYAATYPEHAGRIVLDSPVNYASTFEDQFDDRPRDSHALLAQRALLPSATDPDYAVDAGTALPRLGGMPYQARKAWAAAISTPAELVAALTMADWIPGEGGFDSQGMIKRILTHRFHAKADVNDAVREAALRLAYIAGESVRLDASINRHVYYGLLCGDTPWRKDADSLHAAATSQAVLYPAADPAHLFTGAVCRHWRSPTRWRPPLVELAKAPPLLLVQAEFDPVTSLRSTNKAFAASPGAYLVVASDMYGHGIFGMSHTHCIERGVGVFLLRGETPSTRFSRCTFRKRVRANVHRASPLNEDVVRARLTELLRRS